MCVFRGPIGGPIGGQGGTDDWRGPKVEGTRAKGLRERVYGYGSTGTGILVYVYGSTGPGFVLLGQALCYWAMLCAIGPVLASLVLLGQSWPVLASLGPIFGHSLAIWLNSVNLAKFRQFG